MGRTLTVYYGELATQTLSLALETDTWEEAADKAAGLGSLMWGVAQEVSIEGREHRCFAEKQTATDEWIEIT